MLLIDGSGIMSNSAKILGANLKRLRGDLSQGALAKQLGVDRSQIHHWESGNSFVGGENLDKIAAFFNVALTDLFDPKYVPNFKPVTPILGSAELTLEQAIKVVNEHWPEIAIRKRKPIS